MPDRRYFRENPVFDESVSAVEVLAKALGVSTDTALQGLRAVVAAGYVVAPRDPTNAMLLAYIQSYGQKAANPATVITAVGKARKRWRAMAGVGTEVALSRKRLAEENSS